MKLSLEMLVADGRMDRWTYGWDQIYRTPVSSAGGPIIVVVSTSVIYLTADRIAFFT